MYNVLTLLLIIVYLIFYFNNGLYYDLLSLNEEMLVTLLHIYNLTIYGSRALGDGEHNFTMQPTLCQDYGDTHVQILL